MNETSYGACQKCKMAILQEKTGGKVTEKSKYDEADVLGVDERVVETHKRAWTLYNVMDTFWNRSLCISTNSYRLRDR